VASGSDWVFLGPKGLDEQHYGIVISIAVDKSANDFNTIYAGTGSSGLWKTTDGGKTWKNISDPAFSSGVGISSILIHSEDNNTIYIGTGTAGMDRKYGYGLGIYKSTDGGQSWSATSLAFQPEECTQIVKIICDPEYSERMIALSETAIFRTFDGWEHYQKVENYPQNWLDDCGLSWYYPYKALKDGLLFTENDTRKLYVTSSGFICCDVNNPTPCGAEIWELDNIFNIEISNITFTNLTSNALIGNTQQYYQRFSLDWSSSDENAIFIGGVVEDYGNPPAVPGFIKYRLFRCEPAIHSFILERSFDVGPGWQSQFAGVDKWRNNLIISDKNAGYAFIGGFFLTVINRSTNAVFPIADNIVNNGYHYYHIDTRAMESYIKNGTEYLIIGNDGGVTRCVPETGEQSRENINGKGLYITQIYGVGSCEDYPKSLGGGSQDNNLFYYYPDVTGQALWEPHGSGDAYDIIIHGENRNLLYYTYGDGSNNSVKGKENGFNDFGFNAFFHASQESSIVDRPMVFNPDYTNAYLGYHNLWKSVVTTSDLGVFDTKVFDADAYGVNPGYGMISIAISESDPDYMYIAYAAPKGWIEDPPGSGVWIPTYMKIFMTSDGGSTWTDLTEQFPDYENVFTWCGITGITVSRNNPKEIWISMGNFASDGNDLAKWRVFYTPDIENEDFTDFFSSSLPNLPVNCIEMIGTPENEDVVIGTDAGVFIFDTENQHWIPFNNHLAPAIVTDLEYIDSDNNQNYPSSLRIATFGYGIWETPTDCGVYGDLTYITAPDVVWDSDRTMHNSVIIESGGKLTITAKISFVEGTGIYVKKGGILDVQGGTLTNACNSLWNGVFVYGNPSAYITNYSEQGYAAFRLLGEQAPVVENALYGVITVSEVPEGEGNMGEQEPLLEPAGGIIKAYNTIFRNNYYDVVINPYRYPKIDDFKQCTFTKTQELPNNTGEKPRVLLRDVENIDFTQCLFQIAQSYSATPAGTGIQSFNSEFSVDGIIDNGAWNSTQFINFDYGIKALSFTPTRTFRVEHTNFSGNNTGLYVSGVSAAQVTRNEFTVLKQDTLARDHFGGMYLDFCNGYMVEDNVFNGPGGGDDPWAIGLIINNSNFGSYVDADNEVYNNEFHDLNIGILAQNKNRSNSMGTFGLTLKCNDFDDCRYDIAVTVYDPNNSYLGIKGSQGQIGSNPTFPAGNVFSTFTGPMIPHDDYNYHNEGGGLTYFHHDHINPPYPSYKVRPSHYSTTNVSPTPSYPGNFYDPITCCLSHFITGGGSGGIEDQKMLLGEYGSDADSVSNLLVLLVDGGNTSQTNQDVITSTPPEAIEVYNDLISKSPYLSDTVMVSAVNQETVLDAAMVTDILSENPQAAKSDTVLYELGNRMNPLSDDQMTEVMQGLYTTGAKEALESNLAGFRNDHSRTLNNIVRYYASDTLCVSPVDSLIAWLGQNEYLWAKYHQVFAMNEKGDSAGVSALLENIAAGYSFTAAMTADHQNYLDLLDLFSQCMDSSKSILQIDSAVISEMNSINQDSCGLTYIYAKNILTALGEVDYSEPYLLPAPGMKETKVFWHKNTIVERNTVKVYPNPAGTYCVFEIELKDFKPGSVLVISDEQGKKIESLVLKKNHDYLVYPLGKIPSGLYICSVISGGKIVQSAKLIVNK